MTSIQIIGFFTLTAIVFGYMIWKWQKQYEIVQQKTQSLYQQNQLLQNEGKRLQEQIDVLQTLLYRQEAGIVAVLPSIRLLGGSRASQAIQELLRIVQVLLGATECGVYQIGQDEARLLYGIQAPASLPRWQTVDLYEKLSQPGQIILKRPEDRPETPVLAALIDTGKHRNQVLIVRRMDFYRLTEVNLQLLSLLLELVEERLQRAEGVLWGKKSTWEGYSALLKSLLGESAERRMLFALADKQQMPQSAELLQKHYEQTLYQQEEALSSLDPSSYLSYCHTCREYAESGIPDERQIERLYEKLRETASTATVYFPAVAAFPDYLVSMYMKTGKGDLAYQAAKQMTRQFPRQAEGYMRLLEHYFNRGEFQQIPDVYRSLRQNVDHRRIPDVYRPVLQQVEKIKKQ